MSEAKRPPTSPLVAIRAQMPHLAPAEQRIAEFVLKDAAAASAMRISELAEACSTSLTTVVRTSRALGYDGYPQLRLALATAVGQSEAEPAGNVSGDIGVSDSIEQIIRKVAYADAHAITDTADQLDHAALREAADAVREAGRIELFGIGASAHVATDAQQKLHRIGLHAFAWTDPHAALTSTALASSGDVVVGISHTGETIDTIDVMALGQRRGATTIAITNFPRSTITDHADIVLTTAARETTFRSGAMASRIAQLTIIDMLFIAVAQGNRRAVNEMLRRTREAVADRRHGR
jgi:DNA-binding MurR/RpiR family transcriptional regulator